MLLMRFQLPSLFSEREDFQDHYADPADGYASRYPHVSSPEDPSSPELVLSQWISHELYGEQMPGVAADLLDAGYDTPSLRRLAGETEIQNSADAEALVGSVFKELGLPYPISIRAAKLITSRQIAREVIAGKRNSWDAASHLEIAIWSRAYIPELESIVAIRDELDWHSNRRPFPELKAALIDAFAELAVLPMNLCQ